MSFKMPVLSKEKAALLREGIVIPAHPLALNSKRRLDEKSQRALTRYYLAAGAGGIAVGVHTTQFEIHDKETGMYEPVLRLAAETLNVSFADKPGRPFIKVAGICGRTPKAVKEAVTARELGYDIGLLSLSAMKNAPNRELIEHSKAVAEVIPLFGFYLQPSVGGRRLDIEFWREFFKIDNVAAVKIAPFNRYFTIDVVRALAETGREDEVVLYTGNDDSIVVDLLTPFNLFGKKIIIAGGLLGHWSFWTKNAVNLLQRIKKQRSSRGENFPRELLAEAAQITDCNSVIFDAPHNFKGCIPGINEIMRRSGLMKGRWCINPDERLSPGQSREIDRLYKSYPHLTDDDFIKKNIHKWF